MKAIAPGKLIISGEHAVVYGKPALAMAIDLSAESRITTGADPELISFNLVDLKENERFTIRALTEIKARVARNYHLFLDGKLGIRDVLHKPIELFEFAFINLLDGLHLKVSNGLDIQTSSSIPIGCGMGSSAATVLSVLRAIGHYFRVEFRPDWYLRYSIEAEKIQHGFPSGVDSWISLYGGCALFQNGQAQSVPLPRLPVYLVQTGQPESTTGECVVQVGRQFKQDKIWDLFQAVTVDMVAAIRRNSIEEVQRLIRENHKLLCHIGVVPSRVQSFVSDVEQWGGAAKICGAGSVSGDKGGIVLTVAERPPVDLCNRYGYSIIPVRGDPLGTRIV